MCFSCKANPRPCIKNTPISRFSESNSGSKATEIELEQLSSQIKQIESDRMTKITMTVEQLLKIYALHENYADLRCHAQVLEQRNEEMAIELEKERVKTNHF